MLARDSRRMYTKSPELSPGDDTMPFKNPHCPYYRECLDTAVQENWPQFTCVNCEYRDLHISMVPDRREIEGYYNLLEKIFKV